MQVGLIAGESSGDLLGGGLISALSDRVNDAEFFGIAGDRMRAAGCEVWFSQERLAVMGLFEVIKHLPDLLKVRRGFMARMSQRKCDVFVGIDAPDFNLGVEERLKKRGIPTVHYVSPSVWAWRSSRIKKIERAADLVLCILPFEKAFYDKHGLNARFVGHPLADEVPLEVDQQLAKRELGIEGDGRFVAVLPGSRGGELKHLGPVFVATMKLLLKEDSSLRFVAPMATPRIKAGFNTLITEAGLADRVVLVEKNAQKAMAAADVVLLASGTATLEALLLKKPHVVAYRVSPATAWLVQKLKLIDVDHFSLSNLLAEEKLVPEFFQDAATPQVLANHLLTQLHDREHALALSTRFAQMHTALRRNASAEAARGVLELVGADDGSV